MKHMKELRNSHKSLKSQRKGLTGRLKHSRMENVTIDLKRDKNE